MEFNQKRLQQAIDSGSQHAAESFSKLSSAETKVLASRAESVSMDIALDRMHPQEGYAIVVYAQLLSGTIPGITILTMSREDALALIDLLNHQPVGTTGILQDIDRSAIKETLNILSNSYITAFAKGIGVKLMLSVPNLITPARLNEIIEKLMEKHVEPGDGAVMFESTLTITQHRVRVHLYFIFSKTVVTIIKNTF